MSGGDGELSPPKAAGAQGTRTLLPKPTAGCHRPQRESRADTATLASCSLHHGPAGGLSLVALPGPRPRLLGSSNCPHSVHLLAAVNIRVK